MDSTILRYVWNIRKGCMDRSVMMNIKPIYTNKGFVEICSKNLVGEKGWVVVSYRPAWDSDIHNNEIIKPSFIV